MFAVGVSFWKSTPCVVLTVFLVLRGIWLRCNMVTRGVPLALQQAGRVYVIRGMEHHGFSDLLLITEALLLGKSRQMLQKFAVGAFCRKCF